MLKISRSITSSPDLRNKKELIEKFLDRMTPEAGEGHEEWDKYLAGEKKRQMDEIISGEKLKPEKTQEFIDRCFKDGYVEENGRIICRGITTYTTNSSAVSSMVSEPTSRTI